MLNESKTSLMLKFSLQNSLQSFKKTLVTRKLIIEVLFNDFID